MMIERNNRARQCRRVLSTLALASALFCCAAAGGQLAEEKGGVEITIRDVTAEGQLIRVPVNKSVLVDFSVPVREVRLAKPEFAEVTAISPKQILVTGKSFGTTQMIVWIDGDDQRVFDVAGSDAKRAS